MRFLSEPRPSSIRVLSLCAGDGRDLIPLLSPDTVSTGSVVLVEKDPELARAAKASAAERRLDTVQVVTADAADHAKYAFAYPVDLLLLCGIFGNVPDADVKTVVAATPKLLRDRGVVIWTRGWTDPDLRPSIRRSFSDAGLHEVAFDSEDRGYGVGVAIKPAGVTSGRALPERLFRFFR